MASRGHDHGVAQEMHWSRFWHGVSTDDWNRQSRPSRVRLDRLFPVESTSVRHEGVATSCEVFDGVIAALYHHRSQSPPQRRLDAWAHRAMHLTPGLCFAPGDMGVLNDIVTC